VLDEEVDVDRRSVAHAQLPEQIPLPPLEVGRDEGGAGPLQGLEVELIDPGLLDEPANELLHHAAVGKQQAVAEILSPHNLPSLRRHAPGSGMYEHKL